MIEKVLVPDVGDANDVEVVEILVAVGDQVEADASLVVLESDKASMEIPSPCAGKITSISISEGDSVEEGSLICEIETAGETEAAETGDVEEPESKGDKQDAASASGSESADEAQPTAAGDSRSPKVETATMISVPDVGDAAEVVVVEILVQRGDSVEEGDSIVVLESDKASMEIPASTAGVVAEVLVHEGDEVKEGDPLMTIAGLKAADEVDDSTADAADSPANAEAADTAAEKAAKAAAKAHTTPDPEPARTATGEKAEPRKLAPPSTVPPKDEAATVHAGPAVRKQAREYGVKLDRVTGSGRKGRILKEDIQAYVKKQLQEGGGPSSAGAGIPEIPLVDFSKWGEVEQKPLSRIRKASARNLHRSWLNVPHVTQFDEADITDLESFRSSQNEELKKQDIKLTPLAFLICAVVDALKTYPQFNSSIAPDYDHLVIKRYFNIGIAVETDDGLVVPVLKNADQKGVIELAQESAALAAQARDKKLPMDAMQGATFTISSLGGIGGTAFTPIVNAPEVAILGVSRSKVSPVWNGESFEPRTILPLSLSYDHRAIDGAEAARFTSYLARVLSDIRRVIL